MDKEKMKEQILEQLEEVIDPELNVDIVNLGLIYGIDLDDDGNVKITMTLTSMGCPLAGVIQQQVVNIVQGIEGINQADVDIVWNPPWDKSRMSRYAKIALGIFD
ncbi:MAG: metal-sulfur cluster assembly factor [Thermoactinomyces sp.]